MQLCKQPNHYQEKGLYLKMNLFEVIANKFQNNQLAKFLSHILHTYNSLSINLQTLAVHPLFAPWIGTLYPFPHQLAKSSLYKPKHIAQLCSTLLPLLLTLKMAHLLLVSSALYLWVSVLVSLLSLLFFLFNLTSFSSLPLYIFFLMLFLSLQLLFFFFSFSIKIAGQLSVH